MRCPECDVERAGEDVLCICGYDFVSRRQTSAAPGTHLRSGDTALAVTVAVLCVVATLVVLLYFKFSKIKSWG